MRRLSSACASGARDAGAALHRGLAAIILAASLLTAALPATAGTGSASAPAASQQATGANPVIDGRAIYERRCSVCHGDRGAGAFWASDSLDPPPRDFTRTDRDAVSRDQMIAAVAAGREGTAMTAWGGRLSADEISAVVDYIRGAFMTSGGGAQASHGAGAHQGPAARAAGGASAVRPGRSAALAKPGTGSPTQAGDPPGAGMGSHPQGDAAKGGVFYHANCAECHGHAGNGRGRRADMMVYKPLDFTSQKARAGFDRARLFVSIARGVNGTTMPAWSKVLSDQEIANVAEYVFRAFLKGGERVAEAGPVVAGDGAHATQAAPAGESGAKTGKPAGERVYLQYCSYCHGYNGDARTAAADVLDPKPRDFTKAPKLGADHIAATVSAGRAGTAMPSFAKVLSKSDIAAVAGYVADTLAAKTGAGGRYHTAENGWPDHDARYGPAIPFALGELPVDAPAASLTPEQRAGLELFKGACVSCHFGKPKRKAAVNAQPHAPHAAGDYEEGPHDIAPEIADLTPVEAEGRRLYQQACAQCHAADGSGQNWIGRFLVPSPPGLGEARFKAMLASGEFVTRTLRPPEGTTMPSFETVLSHEQAAAIAAYVARAFQKPD